MRQAVTITGLSIAGYDRVMNGISAIHALFSRQFKENTLEIWQTDSCEEHQAIAIANQYFTHRSHCPGVASVPFHSTVDPHGRLADISNDKLIHTEDNEVLYFKQVNNETNSTKT